MLQFPLLAAFLVASSIGARAQAPEITSQPVSVSVDPSQPARDSYGRRLAYVTADGQDVGEQLISGGFARRYHLKTQRPPIRDSSYRRAEQQAREAGRGLWGQCS